MAQGNEPGSTLSARGKAWAEYREQMGGIKDEFYPATHRAFTSGYEAGKEAIDAYQEGYNAAEAFYAVPNGIPDPVEMRQAWWAAYTKSIRDRPGSHPTTAAEAKVAKEAGVTAVIALIQEYNESSK